VTGRRDQLLLALAGIAALVQLGILARDYAVPSLASIWAMRGAPAWERAALFEEGEEFAGFVAFLRSVVPPDGRVILPPTRPERPVAHIGFMQYYLFPRDIHNCGYDEVDDCILRVVGRNTFILSLPDFPPRDLALQSKRFIPYSGDYGVFAPR
jgi:hypothetical protein